MMYGAEYQACQETTAELVDCLDARAAHWQAEMEEAFSKALAFLSGDRMDRFRAVQELWLAYRRANCGFYREGEGTISQIQASECMRSMTADWGRNFGCPGCSSRR